MCLGFSIRELFSDGGFTSEVSEDEKKLLFCYRNMTDEKKDQLWFLLNMLRQYKENMND